MILSDALRAERPSLWGSSALPDWEHRGSEEIACRRARACVCEDACVSGGETLFLDVSAQPSLPLLSNTSLLFRGFHRRTAASKTRKPAYGAAGAGPSMQRHTRQNNFRCPSTFVVGVFIIIYVLLLLDILSCSTKTLF